MFGTHEAALTTYICDQTHSLIKSFFKKITWLEKV